MADQGQPPVEAWHRAVAGAGESDALTDRDCELLLHFGEGLGKSDVEGQLAHCAAFEELFADRLQSTRQELSVKGKLYSTLGMIGGAGLALMLY